jgi:hypothetical protein
MKPPALDAGTSGVRADAGPSPAPRAGADAPDAASAPIPADRIDIQPLDTASALQILIAEVRAEFGMPNRAAATEAAFLPLPAAAPTARQLVELLLQAASADHGAAADPADAEAAFRSALDRAVEVVSQWRDVPPSVIDAVRETRSQVNDQLSDDCSRALWMRPEWLQLAPAFAAFRRRRRIRRGLTDPDPRPHRMDRGSHDRPSTDHVPSGAEDDDW